MQEKYVICSSDLSRIYFEGAESPQSYEKTQHYFLYLLFKMFYHPTEQGKCDVIAVQIFFWLLISCNAFF